MDYDQMWFDITRRCSDEYFTMFIRLTTAFSYGWKADNDNQKIRLV